MDNKEQENTFRRAIRTTLLMAVFGSKSSFVVDGDFHCYKAKIV